MTLTVDACAETLMRQAGYTAEVYMLHAIECIDKELGKGAAKQNLGLIGDFMKTAALDYLAACTVVAGQQISESLDSFISTYERLSESLDDEENDHRLP